MRAIRAWPPSMQARSEGSRMGGGGVRAGPGGDQGRAHSACMRATAAVPSGHQQWITHELMRDAPSMGTWPPSSH